VNSRAGRSRRLTERARRQMARSARGMNSHAANGNRVHVNVFWPPPMSNDPASGQRFHPPQKVIRRKVHGARTVRAHGATGNPCRAANDTDGVVKIGRDVSRLE